MVVGLGLPVFQSLRPSKLIEAAPLPLHGESTQCTRLQILATRKVVKARKIILSEDIQFLGKAGELVTVKAGYFRNYLYPQGKAKMATSEYLNELKRAAEQKEADKKKLKDDALELANEIQKIGVFSVKRKRGMARLIFGTVTSQDLADIIEYRTKRKIDKRNLTVPEIRQIGMYTAEVKLHPEVTTQVKINVVGN